MTRATICATITLEAKDVYDRYAARREGSSMISDAILYWDEHGPSSKAGLPVQVALREQSIRFFQNEIRKLNAEIKAAGDDSVAIGFDEDTGLFHFRD